MLAIEGADLKAGAGYGLVDLAAQAQQSSDCILADACAVGNDSEGVASGWLYIGRKKKKNSDSW